MIQVPAFVKRDLTKNTSWQQARFEVCHHKWCDMSESGSGIAIINEGKYGVGLEKDEISLSLLRATIRPDITSVSVIMTSATQPFRTAVTL